MAGNTLVNMFKVKELRSRLLFTLAILAVYRLGCVLTIPGINAQALVSYFDSLAKEGNNNAFASYMDFFVGGAFSQFSVFMLGVMPYISTQIIMQLLMIVFPSIKRTVQEDGGQQKFALWTRLGTIVVCIIQAYAVTAWAGTIPGAVSLENPTAFRLLTLLTVTTGSMITIWLGDQITARGIGNGISILIFAGIVARIPNAIVTLFEGVRNGSINVMFVIAALIIYVAVIALVAFEEGGERKIPVHYAKRVVGRKMYGGQSTYIPFKVNPSNVIPLIFASSFLTLPMQVINSFAGRGEGGTLAKLSSFLNPSGIWYNILLVVLIVFFAYFYTQVTLNPTEIAKQIRENGGSIPGVSADKTEATLQKILNRLVLPGSLFLAAIAVIPTVIQILFKFPPEITHLMGGTSLIIMVGVATDTMAQIEALLKMHHQDGFIKKGKIRSRNL